MGPTQLNYPREHNVATEAKQTVSPRRLGERIFGSGTTTKGSKYQGNPFVEEPACVNSK